MNITRQSLKNPAAVIVMTSLLMVFGIISGLKLPIQLTPDIEQPQITISSGWRSAAPEEIEAVILEPLENAVKNTPGVIDINTNINRGFGNITLTFDVGADMQQAMLNVLNSLNQAPPLPIDAQEPIVSAAGTGQNAPNAASLLIRPVEGSDIDDVTRFQKLIDDVVEPRLSRIEGVGIVNLNSRRPKELRISFDPYRAASLGLSVNQIAQTIARSNDTSGGFADVGRRQYTVRFAGQYDIESMGEMIVGYSGDRPIALNEVATVAITQQDRFGFTLRNGSPGYYITVPRTNGSNTVAVLDDINIAIKELNEGPLAAVGLTIDLSFDASVHIRNALELVKGNLGLGVILALSILWLFLRGWRPTLIIAITIPVAVAVSFITLNFLGRSLNVISLAGLAFSVGLVLDAAIIVQENIVRLRDTGMDNYKAVLKGTLEVTGALFASTATTVAIFFPIMFMQGIEGQLFSDLALTLSVAVISSLLTATAILPVASRFGLIQQSSHDPMRATWQKLSDWIISKTNSQFTRLLWVGGLLGGSFIVIFTLMPRTDFMPRAPIDGFFFNLSMPPGGNLQFLEEELSDRVKVRLAPYMSGEKEPAVKSYNFYTFGPGSSGGFIYAADPKRVEELMQVIQNEVFAGLPDTQVFLFRGSMINLRGGNGRSISLDIQGPDIEALMDTAAKGMGIIQSKLPQATARPIPGLALSEPELQLMPNDRRITQAGLDRSSVANVIRAYTGGMFVSEYFDGNERMNVILRGSKWYSPDELSSLPISTPLAGVQTVGELTRIERTVGPTQLRRVNGRRTVSLIINPPAEMSLEETLDILNQQVLPALQQTMPENVSLIVSGSANQLHSAINEMAKNFALAIIILLMLMAALFRSLKDSLLVLSVMPLAVAGGVLGLWVLNIFSFQSLDLLTMIGFIILLGLVVNNAILLVDQTRQAQKRGLLLTDAVAEAVKIRARPVYMSSLTSLFGMLPLMIIPGVGSEIYRGLATVIVGGMTVTTLFTLILMPALLRWQWSFSLAKHSASTALKKG
ncbi:MAG: efflux RND transporter permease subunit [Gammaproteobacteria bacterium]|nr:efflux RND transporter permease subunit [Gammaproteobacteria bacterium]